MPARASPRSSRTCASAATRPCSTGRSGSTASGRGCASRPEQLRAARLAPDALAAVRALADAVAAFCAPQRPPDVAVEAVEGVLAERRWLPLSSVGVYVPGGRAAYPSSLVMAAVPAQVAGVERIAVVTPRPAEATLAAAHALGIDEVYAVGGAQAVAALAYGTETIAPVDKIVGPGNRWVTAAKLLVSSRVGIDLPAGPSEVVVIADAPPTPARCAADLLAQAEHGADSEAILLSLDRRAERRRRPARRRPRERLDPRRRVARGRTRALRGLRARAPRALDRRRRGGRPPDPERRHRLRAHLGRRRRLRGGRDAHPPDGRPRPRLGRPRAGDVPQADSDRPRRPVRARARPRDRRCRWRGSKGSICHAAALELA